MVTFANCKLLIFVITPPRGQKCCIIYGFATIHYTAIFFLGVFNLNFKKRLAPPTVGSTHGFYI